MLSLAVKYSSKLDIICLHEILLHSLRAKMNFLSLVY